ncbi:GatB/YqeY domain-containing protein [Loigolactobacillus zhaoyuanensis]|uniref:GatB/YqeY domain-containing protein n=1 Tax=Loigolactobacillus zhaoyuanensis TaxID=2486017 RepID=A0ABW8UEA1_9LACO|nr:GatB/YqeY domain-containing protein [Loigolactobacillus zhaoyuanensis]
MSLIDTLNVDLKTAMKARDKARLAVVRMLKAAVTNEQIKLGHELNEQEGLAVLATELKQRKESLEEFSKAGRDDLVTPLQEEIKIVKEYLPQQLTEAEVSDLVTTTVAKLDATSMKDFGKVMQTLMPQVKGRADGALVNRLVKSALTK